MEKAWLLLSPGQGLSAPSAGDIVLMCGKGLAVTSWREVAAKGARVAGACLLQLVSLCCWVASPAELIKRPRSLRMHGHESWSHACSIPGDRFGQCSLASLSSGGLRLLLRPQCHEGQRGPASPSCSAGSEGATPGCGGRAACGSDSFPGGKS